MVVDSVYNVVVVMVAGSFNMNKRTLSRFKNTYGYLPKCSCGCNEDIHEGDRVKPKRSGQYAIITYYKSAHFLKLLH